MIELFREASETTQNIIIAVNILSVVYYLATLQVENKVAVYGGAVLVLYVFYEVVHYFSGITFKLFFIFYQFPALVVTLLLLVGWWQLKKYIPEKELGAFEVRIPLKGGKNIVVDILRGVSITGSSGSGKTISCAGWILYWLGQRNTPLLAYDYKDFELARLLQWFYKDSSIPIHYFSPGQPNKSVQINPIAPNVIKKKEDLVAMAKCIVNNLLSDEGEKGDKFFVKAAEGAIAGVITRLREDYPQYCTYAYLTAIFLIKDTDEIVSFITKNMHAITEGRAFLDGVGADKQMAGVKASLSNAFRQLNIPAFFYLMNGNNVDLAINDKNKSVICLVNQPKYASVYSPVLSIVGQAVIQMMSQEYKDPSVILIDEAHTFKLHEIEKVASTMRSFNIATVYMVQDKVQIALQIGAERTKALFANLSTLFFGKTNEPDTAKFVENYFEDVKVKQKSFTQGSGVFSKGERRVTISEKDEKKHKGYQLFKRKTGQFFIFNDQGESYDATIKKPHIEPQEIKPINTITEYEMERYYETILKNAKKMQ